MSGIEKAYKPRLEMFTTGHAMNMKNAMELVRNS